MILFVNCRVTSAAVSQWLCIWGTEVLKTLEDDWLLCWSGGQKHKKNTFFTGADRLKWVINLNAMRNFHLSAHLFFVLWLTTVLF